MSVTSFLALATVVLTGMGYGFKKTWLLWLALPFWLITGIYVSFYQTWFPSTAQHTFVLLGIAGAIAVGFAAVRMQMKPLTNKHSTVDDVDEPDDEEIEYAENYKKYQETSKRYRTHPKRRQNNF